MCLEDKDEEFTDKFYRFINSEDIKDIDNEKRDNDENVNAAKRNVDRTHKTSDVTEIENISPYLGMELGLKKGDESVLHFARVKK